MQIETLAVRLRPRSPLEAADLGVRMCQARARQIYTCYAMVCIPVSILSLAAVTIRNPRPEGRLAPQHLLHCALDAPASPAVPHR